MLGPVQDLALTATPQPTLETLRTADAPAWLWDGARGRIVWANAAGVKLFDGETVFDLVDRPFDGREPGVQRIKEIVQALNPGESTDAQLLFPSMGLVAALPCRCWIHALADGRPGVLVVREPDRPKITRAPASLADQFMEALPTPAVVSDGTGAVLHGNEAARSLLDLDKASHLKDILAGEPGVSRLLERLAQSSMTHVNAQIASKLGLREARITALKPGEDDRLVLLIEDITDRRALERSLAAVSTSVEAPAEPPAPALAKEQAFEKLALSMKESLKDEAPPARPARPKAAPEAEAPKPAARPERAAPPPAPCVPDAIKLPLEQTGEAVIIGRASTGLYATRRAAELLDLTDPADVLSDSVLLANLTAVPEVATRHQLVMSSGSAIDLIVSRSTVPWLNGPAEQYLLRKPVNAPATVRAEAKPAQTSIAPAAAAEVEPIKPQAAAEQPKAETVAPAPPPSVDAREAIATDDMKAILDVASDGIITLDREGRILSFSAGAEAIFGLAITEVIDRPLADLLAQDSRRSLRDYLSALNGPGLASVFNDGREVTAIVKQGGSVPLFLTIGKLQSPKSRAAFCAVVRDITTWKRTERELLQAKEAAEAASRQKSDFLARISHELRTPLNAIMGFSEVMRLERFGEIKNEKYRSYANDIHASGSHLLSLINDLLDLSKVESGKLELNFTAVSLQDVIDHAVRLLQEDAKQARVVVRISLAKGLPRVVADLRAMRQVMINLLSNAIKYTDAGGQVIVSATLKETGDLLLRVKDTGIGMSESQLKDALEPFTRVDTPHRERQGTGLGLPLTKALVEANRASFALTSEAGKGTLAEICFPVTRVLAE